jgi:hypothetical protein
MNRRIVIAALISLFALAPVAMRAQSAGPTPSDPHVYEDLGMKFRAPENMLLMGRRVLPVKALTNQMQTVALWRTRPGKGRDWVIQLSMESYPGRPNVDSWDTSYENELREQIEGVFVRGKEHTRLSNGMPALFMDVSYGEGFTSRKQFLYIWSDGARGIALSITGALGDISADDAKKALAEASAVLYPLEREPE